MKLYSFDGKLIKESYDTPYEDVTGIVEYSNGTKYWLVNGKPHRTDGPAVEWARGKKEWWFNGKLHRTDGPAYECSDGTKGWYVDGKPHRLNGPAVEYTDGSKEWWIDGKQITEQECKLLVDIMKIKGLL